MILFFGTRTVYRDDPERLDRQQVCPACGQGSVLRARTAQNFFHIFWIPLIPLGKAQTILECSGCKARFIRPSS